MGTCVSSTLHGLYIKWIYPLIEKFIISCVDNKSTPKLETFKYGTHLHENDDILLFIHGFPDNHTLWDKQIKYFSNKYLCYTLTLPNYSKSNITNKYGYDWNIVAKLISDFIKKISLKNNNSKKISLIMHDFGTIYGYMAYKILLNNINDYNIISNLIFIDVADGLNFETSKIQQIAFLFYHWFLLFTFFLPNFIGKFLIFLLVYISGAPLCQKFQISEISNYMAYPYFHLWRRKLNIGGSEINCNELTMWNYPNNVNIFFAFGTEFIIKFHTKKWREYLKQNNNCFYKGYNCGHWVMNDKSNEFNKDLKQWLQKVH